MFVFHNAIYYIGVLHLSTGVSFQCNQGACVAKWLILLISDH